MSGMKICIIGYSGSGKSTMAEKLSARFALPCLHMDKIGYQKNWQIVENEERKRRLKAFLQKNPSSWVIDGNYNAVCFEERLDLADWIVFLNFNRFTCYFRALKRAIVYRDKQRESAPEGCREKFSLSFQRWILFEGRKKKNKQRYQYAKSLYPDKFIELKNRGQVERFLQTLGD